jgi:hypothetical protein
MDKTKLKELSLLWIPLLIIGTAIYAVYTYDLQWNEPNLSLHEMTTGTAHKPFVYRVLVPGIINFARFLIPLPAQFYASLLIYCSLFGFAFSMYHLAGFFWESPSTSRLVALTSMPALLPLMLHFQHIYDIPNLFLFTLSIGAIIKQRWSYFLPIFILNCLSKETALLLPVIFMAYFHDNMDRRLYIKLTAAQLAIYAVIRFILLYAFRDNPGTILTFRLWEQLNFVINMPIVATGQFLYGLLMFLLAAWQWKTKPIFLRRSALAITPLMLLLFLFFGYPFEIRVFYEVLPILILLSVPMLNKIMKLISFDPPH